jgi:hypothetical protein
MLKDIKNSIIILFTPYPYYIYGTGTGNGNMACAGI